MKLKSYVLNRCSVAVGEYHGNNPEMSKLLHKAVREKMESAYAVYQEHLSTRPVNVNFFPSYTYRQLNRQT